MSEEGWINLHDEEGFPNFMVVSNTFLWAPNLSDGLAAFRRGSVAPRPRLDSNPSFRRKSSAASAASYKRLSVKFVLRVSESYGTS